MVEEEEGLAKKRTLSQLNSRIFERHSPEDHSATRWGQAGVEVTSLNAESGQPTEHSVGGTTAAGRGALTTDTDVGETREN
jgi:hypothetical protein